MLKVGEWGRIFMLPQDISIQLWELDRDGVRYFVEFNPLGRTTPGTIQLIGSKGETRNVMCRSATEGFEVWDDREAKYATEI